MGKWAKGSPRPLRDLWGRPALPPLPSGKGWGEGPVFARSRAFWLFVAQPSRHRCWVPACAGMTRWDFDVCPLPSSPHRQAQSMQNARIAAPQGRAKRVNRRLSLSSLPFRDQQVLVQGVSSSCGGRVTFLLLGQEKSNPKRRPPRLALAGHPCPASPGAGDGLSTGILSWQKGVDIPVDSLAGLSSPTSPPHRGPG